MRHIWITALLVAACAGDADPEPEQVSAASIVSNSIVSNHLTDSAVFGNRQASGKLIASALPQALQDPFIYEQLADPLSWEVMPYLISCALGPFDHVEVKGPNRTETYWGALGLAKDWMVGPLNIVGQERVSSCLLARVNALGVGVLISVRCEPAAICVNSPQVAPNRVYPHSNIPILSLTPSMTGTDYDDIGWKVDRIGTCGVGTTVSVSTYDYGGSASGPTVLRACPGVHACDDADSIWPMTITPWNNRDQLRFDCPASGQFSVMTAPRNRAVPVSVKTGGKVQGGKFPAPEGWQAADQAVFTWPEGVFFGNILGASSFHKDFVDNYCDKYGHCVHPLQKLDLIVFNAYAATSDVWSDWQAYLHERLCAGIQRNCVAKPLGRARQVCGLADGVERIGDGDYEKCKAPSGQIYNTGITTYLDSPCAIVTGAACNTL